MDIVDVMQSLSNYAPNSRVFAMYCHKVKYIYKFVYINIYRGIYLFIVAARVLE